MIEGGMHFSRGFADWWTDLAKIAKRTRGIVRVVGVLLHVLPVVLLVPTQWVYMGFGTKERPLNWFTEAYVFAVVLLSVWFFTAPSVCVALLSTWISAGTIVVMLHIVLLQGVFGAIASAERSILLFMCNVAQVVVMFGTWYRLCGGYSETEALLKSILTFATISYADKESCVAVAMAQIATDFVLLFIFLSFLLGQLGPKNVTGCDS
jgi:hypothetical protein